MDNIKKSNGVDEKKLPGVGVGVMIMNKKNEILLGLRKNAKGAGEWNLPSGKVEFGETIRETAKREVKEETGLDISEFEVFSVVDELRYMDTDGVHFVAIGIIGKYEGGEPRVMEPEKCQEWDWFSLDLLPKRLFESTELVINNYKAKKFYTFNKKSYK